MDARTRHILKHPGYFGTLQQMMPQYMRKPLLSEITFTKVLQTEVTCTACNGSKTQLTTMPGPEGYLIHQPCAICTKTPGKMMIDNRPENFVSERRS